MSSSGSAVAHEESVVDEVASLRAELAVAHAARQVADEEQRRSAEVAHVANELVLAAKLAAQRSVEDVVAAKALAEKEHDRATDFLAQKLELETEVL